MMHQASRRVKLKLWQQRLTDWARPLACRRLVAAPGTVGLFAPACLSETGRGPRLGCNFDQIGVSSTVDLLENHL
jgi:hypothetical protein